MIIKRYLSSQDLKLKKLLILEYIKVLNFQKRGKNTKEKLKLNHLTYDKTNFPYMLEGVS